MSAALHRSTPPAPVRHVHLGLGNFFRAHQAWYTAHAPAADEWGIAAFTGRRRDVADELRAQDCLYTLITRSDEEDTFEVVSTVSAAHAAADHAAYLRYLAEPQVALVTLTVTEAGYCRDADGGLDHADPTVAADVAALRTDPAAVVTSAPGRLVAGLLARRRDDAGPISIVPCDNLPANGAAVQRVVADLAEAVEPSLRAWMDDQVAFVSTVVDRITPRATDADLDLVRRAGWIDRSPVVTEPYHDWVLSGAFPAGRPQWEDAGAHIVDDVSDFEMRKLWLLNGAHSLLAYSGLVRGRETISEAAHDPTLLGWTREWWDLAGSHLPFGPAATSAYCDALAARFTNGRMRHELRQVGMDGSQKIPVRVFPVLRAERAAGRMPIAAVRVVGAYVAALRTLADPPGDPRADALSSAAHAGTTRDAARGVLALLDAPLADDDELCAAVASLADEVAAP